ncbi:MAG: putative baseplate assembly protein [Bryobacteraceae bacterium]
MLTIAPAEDTTDQLGQSGQVTFRGLPDTPVTEVMNRKGQWLECALTKPFAGAPDGVSAVSVPSLESLAITALFARSNLLPDAGFVNQAPLDFTKEFFPFGLQPRFGDTLYLASREAFAQAGAEVTLQFTLANPDQETTGSSLTPVHATAVKIRWEIGDTTGWIELGTAESGREIHHEESGFLDTTRALTRSGHVSFRVPRQIQPSVIDRTTNVWLRARLVGGDYSLETKYQTAPSPTPLPPLPPTPTPPCLRSLAIDYKLETTSTSAAMVAYNDFVYADLDLGRGPVPLFRPPADNFDCAYLGFTDKGGFSERYMSIYFAVSNPENLSVALEASGVRPTLVWEYWNGSAWAKCVVLDDTAGLTRSGIVRFVAPPDFSATPQFGESVYWLRWRIAGKSEYEPWLSRILLNTVMATQAVTMPAEVLGSSNGSAGQRFVTTRSPVLEGQRLEVREPIMPPPEETEDIFEEEGPDAIRKSDDLDVRPNDVWVRWHEVANFRASVSTDRHYVIDRATGQVLFGDGENGRIPSAGSRNIRIAPYRVGGGSVGNRKPDTITQLKTTIAYVNKVTNFEPASGGADAESERALLSRAPKQIRHRGRAVTAQDLEDLAMLASPQVARARCVPMQNSSRLADPKLRKPGIATVIIAPLSGRTGVAGVVSGAPQPDRELFERVKDYLDARRPLESDLVIMGPEYLPIQLEIGVTITADVMPSDVESAVSRRIVEFLDPITGKRDGSGWQFGEEPSRADLFALAEEVPGVDHVRELRITRIESRPDLYASGQYLICAAEPQVVATLDI